MVFPLHQGSGQRHLRSRMRWKRGNRLKLVSESDAAPRTRALFQQIRYTLGLPGVPVLYQAYAAFPAFLEVHWEAFRPVFESQQFFSLGARLAAESYTRAHNYFEVYALPDGRRSDTDTLSIQQVLDYYQYLDPILLLISTAQMQAFEGPVGQTRSSSEPPHHPIFLEAPQLMKDDGAGSTVVRIWEERRRILELAFIADEHRALACWPDFYGTYWLSLKRLLQSPVYADCQYRLGESAWSMVQEFPVRVETSVAQLLDAGLDDEEVASLSRINEALMQTFTGLVLDMTFARIGWEGGTRNGEPVPPPTKQPASEPRLKQPVSDPRLKQPAGEAPLKSSEAQLKSGKARTPTRVA